MMIETPRLLLRPWRDEDRPAFAALNGESEVMEDLGGPMNRAESDAKLERYMAAFEQHGYGRFAIEDRSGRFLGYAGIMPSRPDHPLGAHAEAGWRLRREAWGKGYATEAARAALDDGFRRCRLGEVLAYTAADNDRSRAVMARLGLERDPARDYSEAFGDGVWHGLVWVARPGAFVRATWH